MSKRTGTLQTMSMITKVLIRILRHRATGVTKRALNTYLYQSFMSINKKTISTYSNYICKAMIKEGILALLTNGELQLNHPNHFTSDDTVAKVVKQIAEQADIIKNAGESSKLVPGKNVKADNVRYLLTLNEDKNIDCLQFESTRDLIDYVDREDDIDVSTVSVYKVEIIEEFDLITSGYQLRPR